MKHASRPHDEAVIELLRDDPQFAEAYLSAAFAEVDEPGGRQALLSALRQVAEARGMANVATRAGLPREAASDSRSSPAWSCRPATRIDAGACWGVSLIPL